MLENSLSRERNIFWLRQDKCCQGQGGICSAPVSTISNRNNKQGLDKEVVAEGYRTKESFHILAIMIKAFRQSERQGRDSRWRKS